MSEKFWWNSEVDHSNKDLEDEILNLRSEVKRRSADDPIWYEETWHVYKLMYTYETLLDEKNLRLSCKFDDIIDIVENTNDVEVITPKESRKFRNFVLAYNFVLKRGDTAFKIDMESICQAHRILMNGLIESAGKLRTVDVRPSGEFYCYMNRHKIHGALEELLAEIPPPSRHRATLSQLLESVAKFLVKFLQIHPFANGNGRLARLLVSRYILDETLVPVCLFRTRSHLFCDILTDSRSLSSAVYFDAMKRFLLENTARSLKLLNFLMED